MSRDARSSLRWSRGLLWFICAGPALMAPKGCYFGAEEVPLGGNFDVAGSAAINGDTPMKYEDDGGAGGAHSSSSSGNAASSGRSPRDMHGDIGVVHGP
jgi:hypothetical protein